MRTLVVFVIVAVAGMALLPETPAHAGVGKDPATAYAPGPGGRVEATRHSPAVTSLVAVAASR